MKEAERGLESMRRMNQEVIPQMMESDPHAPIMPTVPLEVETLPMVDPSLPHIDSSASLAASALVALPQTPLLQSTQPFISPLHAPLLETNAGVANPSQEYDGNERTEDEDNQVGALQAKRKEIRGRSNQRLPFSREPITMLDPAGGELANHITTDPSLP